ncbi:MAG TPA: L,D-transpeptidase family protein [Nocardioidaceae bacterium]|nr:L,D-transpeptidase family protein [Nocardioidaceae bacterium]
MKRSMGAVIAVVALGSSLLVAAPSAADEDQGHRFGVTTEELWGPDPTPNQTRAQARAQSRELADAGARKRPWFRKRFARERTKFGHRDRSPRSMHHVRELQYRLRWAKVYKGPVTGYFGKRTRAAVRRFQKRANLRRTGVANRRTWRKLIPRTVRGRKFIARQCKSKRSKGPHICYNRRLHQVTLWRSGTLWNSWLVRGGSRSHKTRVGNFKVYWRDRDHISSLYGSPMPNSQFFSGGQAFHGSTYMMDPFSGHSHGCVNMYLKDANQLWVLTMKRRPKVHIRGKWS